MKLQSITLQNFHCYGSEPTTVHFDDMTTLIGGNGCGKTAALLALCRMFGITATERRIQKEDFHIPPTLNIDEIESLSLSIEAKFVFPELIQGVIGDAIPECFNQMVVQDDSGELFCRVRLEAEWISSNLTEGDIEERIWWLTEPTGTEQKKEMRHQERSRIQVLYVPATRDPSKQLKNISGTLLHRLLRAVRWSDSPHSIVQESFEQIKEALSAESGVRNIERKIQTNWRGLHRSPVFSQPRLEFMANNLEDILKQVDMVLSPSEDGGVRNINTLSDGLKSLFYLTLVCSIFDIEQEALLLGSVDPSLDLERLSAPFLTIFAIEEPENHLSPHYLGRIINLFKRIAEHTCAQVVLTSHSASILKRIEPEIIRYFRLNEEQLTTSIKTITLPAKADEAYKYIKEAVKAYPEIYFSSLVVLGEGDSEEIILLRVLEAFSEPPDSAFISIVPLGGRYVNHFWKLLTELGIPFTTLLDLDRERHTGGWKQIKYVCQQLMLNGKTLYKGNQTLTQSSAQPLTQADLDEMPDWDLRYQTDWINYLESFDVFFSTPLDVDFMMLNTFEQQYKDSGEGKPRIPVDPVKRQERLLNAQKRTLGEEGTNGESYTESEKELFPWYNYLFLDTGKPSIHFKALSSIEDTTLKANLPPVLLRLKDRILSKLS